MKRPRRKSSPSVPQLVQRSPVREGRPFPLGATWDGLGVNFALFSANATKVELCLFDIEGRQDRLDPLRAACVAPNAWHAQRGIGANQSLILDVEPAAMAHPAWDRMKFDELLAQQLSLKRAQRARREKGAPPLRAVGQLSEGFLAGLPFALTGAQQRVVEEIRADLRAGYPMQRLLQGDVQ